MLFMHVTIMSLCTLADADCSRGSRECMRGGGDLLECQQRGERALDERKQDKPEKGGKALKLTYDEYRK